jgi:hypothetical protein
MPVDNAAKAIGIVGTPSPARPSRVSRNGDSVRVNADVVGLKIRGVPGVPQHPTEGALFMKAPASKKPKPVYTTIARYEKGVKAPCDLEDIQYRIFEHARDFMYKSLQHYIRGDVKDPTDLHIWKLDREYLEDDWVISVKFYRCPFQFSVQLLRWNQDHRRTRLHPDCALWHSRQKQPQPSSCLRR